MSRDKNDARRSSSIQNVHISSSQGSVNLQHFETPEDDVPTEVGSECAAPPPAQPPSLSSSSPGGGAALSGSSQEVACRICHDSNPPLYVWCNCKGTVGLTHKECLEEWLARSRAAQCELCGFVYRTQRIRRFDSRLQSLRPWLRGNVVQQTALLADGLGALLCLAVGAGTAVVCGVGASAAAVASPDVLFLQALCCVASCIALAWFALAVRFHVRAWMRWWRQQYDVRVVPRSEESLRKACAPTAAQAEECSVRLCVSTDLPHASPLPSTRSIPALPPRFRRAQPRSCFGRRLRWQCSLQAMGRNSVNNCCCPWRPSPAPIHGPVIASCGNRSPSSRYATIRENRYFTRLEPFNDWSHGGIPYSIVSLPVVFPNTPECATGSSQIPVLSALPTTPINTCRASIEGRGVPSLPVPLVMTPSPPQPVPPIITPSPSPSPLSPSSSLTPPLQLHVESTTNSNVSPSALLESGY